MLKLLVLFNWTDRACSKRYHDYFLGFTELQIRGFKMRQNWNPWPPPLESAWLDEENAMLAPNLCLGMAYSLFPNSLNFGGVQNPRYFIFVTGTVEKMIMCRAVNGWFESSARFFYFTTLTRILFYIICLFLNIQSAFLVQLASVRMGKAHDLGSSPRSSAFSILFFSWFSYAGSILRHTLHLHNQAIHLSKSTNPKATLWGTWWGQVKDPTCILEKSTKPPKWARITWAAPPWFAIPYLFLLFIFYFVCLISI